MTAALASACGGATSADEASPAAPAPSSRDASANDSGDPCTDAWPSACCVGIESFCASHPCPASWSSARAFAAAQCAAAKTDPLPAGTITTSRCGGYLRMAQGDEFLGMTYFFDTSTGSLRAVVTYSDTHPRDACVAGAADFVEPTDCTLESMSTCTGLDGG